MHFLNRDLLRELGVIGHIITDPVSDPLLNDPRYDWEGAWPVVRSVDNLEIVGVATGTSKFDKADIIRDCYIVEANVSNYI